MSSGALWESDVLSMNDPEEITYPVCDVIAPLVSVTQNGERKYFISRVKEEIVKETWGSFCTHIACFSANSELRSQWEMYAKVYRLCRWGSI